MLEIEKLSGDVLVIGSGIAGIKAAMNARAEGLSVLLISKGPIGRESASFYSGGGFRPNEWLEPFTPMGCLEGQDDLIGDESAIRRYLSESDLVALIAERALKDAEDLISSLKLPLVKYKSTLNVNKEGKYFPDRDKLNKQGGLGGALIMLPMAKEARRMGITCLEGAMAADLLLSEGQVKGALAINKKGKLLEIMAKATILATGGGGDAYANTSCPAGVGGDGYHLALKVGTVLENMEFVHFHALGIEGTTPPLRRIYPELIVDYEGAMMVNGKGENIVEKHLKMSVRMAMNLPLIKLEILPILIAQEIKTGGASIDLTKISSSDWEKILSSPLQRAFFDRVPVDPRKEILALQPVAHTFDGGVKIDLKGQTSVPGLFAAGEVVGGHAGVSYPMSRCLTMGAIAGTHVVPFVKGSKSIQVKESEWEASVSRIKGLMERKGVEDPGELKRMIGEVIYTAGWPVRDRVTLEKGIRELEALGGKMKNLRVENPSQLKDALEAENSLVVGKAVLGAALRREESRGPHFRSDFPRKDASWFKRILISLDKGSGQLKFTEEAIRA